jgi:hypothetical protein
MKTDRTTRGSILAPKSGHMYLCFRKNQTPYREERDISF